jgi:glutamine synthetase
LKELGIELELMHREAAGGQVELVLKYRDIMSALLDYDYAREVISNYFSRSGRRAVFLPKTGESCGNGCHIHLSLLKDGKNVLGDKNGKYGLSEAGQAFIGGILNSFEPLSHILAPHPNSMRRIIPSFWVGAYKFWGIENKEAPIRVCEPWNNDGVITHFEIKTLDHTANLYFATAALIVCGINGIKNQIKLSEPYSNDPALLTEAERNKRKMTLLPKSLEERKAAIKSEAGEPIRKFFGDTLIHNYMCIAESDYAFFEGKSL